MNYAIILAGGVGSRVGANVPKQFIEVQGKPILVYTLEAFQNCPDIDAVEVVCIASYMDTMHQLIEQYGLTKVKYVVEGGATYQDSVMCGMRGLEPFIQDDDVVAIHFGAGAFVTGDLISDSIRVAQEHGNGISSDPVVLCLAIKDPRDPEVFSTEGDDRDRFMGMNSPQTFQWAFLRDLYKEGEEAGIMDKIDPHTTSLMAALKKPLYFSKGSSMNIKITSRDDVKLFNAYLLSRDQEFDF
ncbi:MAG: IspD/TarI family cytidylyltransferase [Coriobacteriia bacterium]|nr:IspD/TarI family cytidylyltransferase [Coriobacteriia bacterium]